MPASEGGWPTYAPSAIAFTGYDTPREMTADDLAAVKAAFVAGAERSLEAGFDVIEIHAAHGYLLHQFLSPLSNQRTDEYGGDFTGRTRFPLEIIEAARAVWPADKPLFVRISATDWKDGGWTLEESILFAEKAKKLGVDLLDVSSGGLVADAKIEVGPGYQVPFSEAIRNKSGLLTGSVGMINDADQAEAILEDDRADAVLVARQFLRDPSFGLHAAHELGDDVKWPMQYERAKSR